MLRAAVFLALLGIAAGGYPMVNSLQNKRFYIYPLPIENWYAFPDCPMFKEFKENGGFGRALDLDAGYFNSWHHSLFYSLFMRLKYSKRRTLNPAEADLFIVPYDFTIKESYQQKTSGKVADGTLKSTCPRRGKRQSCPATSVQLRALLQASEYFQRHQGADHVLINSLTSPFYDCTKIKKQICQRCLGTGYFSYPPVLETKPLFYEERDMSGYVSLPFPSYYHWHEGVQNVPWDESNIRGRIHFATYAGNTQVMIPDHSMLRRILVQQCQRHSQHPDPRQRCLVVDMQAQKKSNSSRSDITSSRSEIMDVEPADSTLIMKTYAKSVFCFVPPGDDPTRKGIVDVILAGCIPVLFNPLTLHAQYPFHLDEATATAVSVLIPRGSVYKRRPNRELLDVVAVLRSVPPAVVREKQRLLALLAPHMVYAAPPLHLLRGLSGLEEDKEDSEDSGKSSNTCKRWDPPFADAASLALDGMFSRAERVLRGLPAMVPEVNRSFPTWMNMYNTTLI